MFILVLWLCHKVFCFFVRFFGAVVLSNTRSWELRKEKYLLNYDMKIMDIFWQVAVFDILFRRNILSWISLKTDKVSAFKAYSKHLSSGSFTLQTEFLRLYWKYQDFRIRKHTKSKVCSALSSSYTYTVHTGPKIS